jgi:hypothetical protein
MPVKTSTSFTKTDTDAELASRTFGIIDGLTDNPDFPNPTPSLADLNAAYAAFTGALAAAAGGGTALTAAKNAARAALISMLRNLAGNLEATCAGNMQMLLGSKFPAWKTTRQPAGILPAPSNTSLDFGPLSGQLVGSVKPLPGAVVYNWRLFAASAPGVILQTTVSTAASVTFTGLTRGVDYTVQANAVGTAGTSDWSNPATQMAV